MKPRAIGTKQNQNQTQRCSAPTVAITGLLDLQFRITNCWNVCVYYSILYHLPRISNFARIQRVV